MRVQILKDYVKQHFPTTQMLDYALDVEKITTSKVTGPVHLSPTSPCYTTGNMFRLAFARVLTHVISIYFLC